MNKFSLGDKTSLRKGVGAIDLDIYNTVHWTPTMMESLRLGLIVEDITKIGATELIGTYLLGSWIYIPIGYLNDKKDCGHPYTSIFK